VPQKHTAALPLFGGRRGKGEMVRPFGSKAGGRGLSFFVLAWNDEEATRPYAPLEAPGNRRPREMATQTQNPAYRVTSLFLIFLRESSITMLTVRNQVVELVHGLSGKINAFDQLETSVSGFSPEQLLEALLECGVIPEAFDHDSSEEKLWAKYCDILLAMSLTAFGVKATVIRARGNSADVLAQGPNYTLVGDAKAFRLSRTAKNQKDFKITALDDWRKADTYACLVGPLTQFPNTRSQIYEQAIKRNVTLISYTHLRFVLEHGSSTSIENLWKIGSDKTATGIASEYWQGIDTTVVEVCGKTMSELEATKRLELEKLEELGNEGIGYWQDRIKAYQKLSQKEAVDRLIKSEKIQAKIQTIKRAITWTKA